MLGEHLKMLSKLELDFDLETIGFEGCDSDLCDAYNRAVSLTTRSHGAYLCTAFNVCL